MGNTVNLSKNSCSSVTFSYKWTLANYSRLYDEDCPWKWEICSDSVSPPNNKQFKLELRLYPKGYCEIWQDYVAIGVAMKSMPQIYEGKVKYRLNVSIVDENGERRGNKNSGIYPTFCNELKVANFISRNELLNSPRKYLPNSNLTLQFSIHLQAENRIFNVITNKEVDTSRFDCANKVTTVVHTWTVDNFDELFGEGDVVQPYFIQSDHFPALDKQIERFCLRLFTNGWSEESKDKVDIGIWNENENNATVHWRMSILDVDEEECYTTESTVNIEAKNGRHFELNRDYLLHNSNGFVHNNQLRIYCQMSYVVDSFEDNQNQSQIQMCDSEHKSESITDVTHKAVHFVSHQWTIPKFSAHCLNAKTNHCIISQIIKPPNDLRYSFHLRLFRKGHDNPDNENVSLDLYNSSPSHPFSQITVQYRISVLGKNEDKLRRWIDQSTITRGDKVRNSEFVLLSIFKTPYVIKNYLADDKLRIICELWVLQDRKIYKTELTSPGTQSIVVNNPSGSATVNMSNANLQGAIVNVNGDLNMDNFNLNSFNNNN